MDLSPFSPVPSLSRSFSQPNASRFFASGKMACAYSSEDQKIVFRVCMSAKFAIFWLLIYKIYSPMIMAPVRMVGRICGLSGAL